MEQLIIFLLFIVASIVSSIIQKKKKAQEEEAARLDLERPLPTGPIGPAPSTGTTATRPGNRWPRTAQEWQEQLRKMVEENAPPVIKPVVIKPVIVSQQPSASQKRPIVAKILPSLEKSEGDLEFKSPLRESASAHQRASNLQSKVEERFRAVDQQTATHRPSSATRSAPQAHELVRRLRKRPTALREAFVASLIFSPPKSLEN